MSAVSCSIFRSFISYIEAGRIKNYHIYIYIYNNNNKNNMWVPINIKLQFDHKLISK